MVDYIHDQNIANGNGAAVRADINSALLAIFSDSSSATAPSTTIQSQRWNDTTANLRKRRNLANSGWIVEGTLSETFLIARASNTILIGSDIGKAISATGTFTQTFTAAATLGDGWYVDYINNGSGVINLDPNGAETINGAATITLAVGQSARIYCNGTGFFALVCGDTSSANTQALTFKTLDLANNTLIATLAQLNAAISDGDIAAGITILALQTTTSGTTKDFTGIPSTAKRIKVLFNGVSLTTTDNFLIQLGDSGGFETTGYLGSAAYGVASSTIGSTSFTTGFGVHSGASGPNFQYGVMTIELMDAATNLWIASYAGGGSTSSAAFFGGGAKSLSATLTQLRVTLTGGAFDAGSVTVSYE